MRKTASFRLTPTAQALLTALAESAGVSKTAILEIVIREAAAKRQIGAAPGEPQKLAKPSS